MAKAAKIERITTGVFAAGSVVAALLLAAQAAIVAWARHGITEVEAIIAAHSTLLAAGEGLYYDLDRHPFTVSPYGPILYSLEAVGFQVGLAPMLVGRLVSIAALIGSLVLAWKVVKRETGETWAAWAATLLAGATANLVAWGSVGQSDMLGLFFSLAAAERYTRYRSSGENPRSLIVVGGLIAAAIFTKQTFLAAGAAITISLIASRPRRGLIFAGCLGAFGCAVAAGLNLETEGGYWQNAVLANLNPFSADKLADQMTYFGLTAIGVVVLTAAGFASRGGRTFFELYLLCASLVFLLTAGKVGADLNYQIETVFALCLCAGIALARLDYFPLLFRGSASWVTLLQIPLLLHIGLNLAISAKSAAFRVVSEVERREQYAALRPYLQDAGSVLSVEVDPLLQAGRQLHVEPLIYRLLVDAGMSDPQPVNRALRDRRYEAILLYEDLFDPDRERLPLEAPSLPSDQLDIIAENYVLEAHAPGPFLGGLYIYRPRSETAAGLGDSGVGAPPPQVKP